MDGGGRRGTGGQGMEGFVGEKEDFICDAGLNWEPVKVDEGWGAARFLCG